MPSRRFLAVLASAAVLVLAAPAAALAAPAGLAAPGGLASGGVSVSPWLIAGIAIAVIGGGAILLSRRRR